MKHSLPVWSGLLAAAIPAVWISLSNVDTTPAFIETSVRAPAKVLGELLFRSNDAGIVFMYPLVLFYCGVFGAVVGLVCWFVLRRRFT